jgi:hypothetical protein
MAEAVSSTTSSTSCAVRAGDIWDAYYCPECGGNPWKLQEITAGGVTTGLSAFYSLSPFVDVYVAADQQHFAYVTGSGAIWDAYHCAECSGDEWKLQQLVGP